MNCQGARRVLPKVQIIKNYKNIKNVNNNNNNIQIVIIGILKCVASLVVLVKQ